jgi:glycopeptide antibiotics resistance protein
LILMVWFGGFCRRGLYPAIAVVLLALGIGLDSLQLLTETRTFDWYDIAMNSTGVIVGLVLSLLLLGGWCQRVEQRLLS